MKRSLDVLCGSKETINLESFLANFDFPQNGLFKCRIVYDDTTRDVEFIPYTPRDINTLRIVEHDRINYDFKYRDRKNIERLYELRNGCDDVLIIKRGLVTDTSYCNIVFRKGRHWYTPWSALLKGTQRQKLLEREHIREEEITLDDIKTFDVFKLINAMLEFDAPEISIEKIFKK